MRPRSVILGEILFIVAVFSTGIVLVIHGWNKDAPSSDMSHGLLLIGACATSLVLHGILRTVRSRRKNQDRTNA